jgi:hypothetical protein
MKRIGLLSLSLLAVSTASAQSIKPRPLGAVQYTSKELLGSPTLARALSNGSVIVNDVLRRRLLLLDASLENCTIIADSTSGSVNGYGQRPGALVPYLGDSTLFLDATASSFLVIDPAGKVVRVMSPPRPNDNNQISNFNNGFPGFDAKGRMVYRSNYPIMPMQARDGSLQMPPRPDSAPLLRVDLDTRRADTIAAIRTPKYISNSVTMPSGGTSMMQTPVPLATIDDWAVLSDGTIAIVRGNDYKIDFLLPDGSKRTSPKIAFDWKRLDDDAKLALIDSIVKARAAGPQGPGGPGGGPQVAFGGGDGMRITMGGGGGGGRGDVERVAAVAGAAMAAGGPGGPGGMQLPALPAPMASDLPDYMPAFTQTSARPDADGNLWIRTTTPGSQPGNFVYDVINNQGNLVDRVDVPKGMTIIGFGKGGAVYLSQREGYGFRVLKASTR